MTVLIAIMLWVNAQPDAVRFEYCDDNPQTISRMQKRGFTVFEDCSILPPSDYKVKNKGR